MLELRLSMGQMDLERKADEEETRFIEYAKEEILAGLRKAQISLSLPAGVEQERAVDRAACLVSEAIGYVACEEIIVGCNDFGFEVFDVRANKTPVKHQIGISNSLHLSSTRQRGLEKDGVTFRSISESANLKNFGATFICRFGRESETSLELLNYITKNIEIVDQFNSEVQSYFKGERQFPAQSYPVML